MDSDKTPAKPKSRLRPRVAAPVLAAIVAAPAAARQAQDMGLPPSLASGLMMLAAYALAGTAVGYLVQRSNFLWSFLFTYLAVGSIVGFHIHPIPYSTFAGTIAHLVAQSAKRRRLILEKPALPVQLDAQRQLSLLK